MKTDTIITTEDLHIRRDIKEYIDDTIAAISTPPGSGGIGIIRISGNESVAIANNIFCMANGRLGDFVLDMPSHTIKHGYIYDPETREIIDECMVTKMLAPYSTFI